MSTIKVTDIQNESSATVNMSLGTAGEVTLAKSPKLNGSTSGTLTIAAPAVAGTNTITFPAATDTVATLAATQTLTNKTIQGGAITSATAQVQPASPSAVANVDFTGIPSWVKRITVMLNGVSTTSTSNFMIQLGDAGGIETSGYTGNVTRIGSSTTPVVNNSSGVVINETVTSALTFIANVIFSKIDGNTYVAFGTSAQTDGTNTSCVITAAKTLSDTLTQVRITTVGGTNTFDAGTINIMYE